MGGFIMRYKNSLNGYTQMQQCWINSNSVKINLCSSVVILAVSSKPDFKEFISPQYVSAFNKNHQHENLN